MKLCIFPKKSGEEKNKGLDKTRISNTPSRKSKDQKRLAAEIRQASSKERNRLKEVIAEQENEIQDLEIEKKSLETELARQETYENPERSAELNRQYATLCSRLKLLYGDWENNQIYYEEVLDTIKRMITERK